ncbi:MAG: hypothetical protein LBB89_05370 [Treponema sp.]|jgi:hypothetical protein|nr:hypothetical protein [Treponema sp.]
MSEIRYRNIPMFIGKMLLMILLNFFSGYILFDINLGYIVLIIFSAYFAFNLYILVILYTKKTVNILKWFDTILLIILIITFTVVFVYALLFVDEVERNSHGALIIIPLVLSIIYFLIAFVIDILIYNKQSNN